MSTKKILMSIAVIVVFVAVLFFLIGKKMHAQSKGTWYIAHPQATDEMNIISDDPFEFKVANMPCGVTKTQFVKESPDSKESTEAREIYCWISDDTFVSTTTNCNLPNYTAQALIIKKKGIQYMPTLMCGPKRK